MDIITVSYYAVVCGVLGLAGPKLGRPVMRLVIGGLVGIGAATILPTVRLIVGF